MLQDDNALTAAHRTWAEQLSQSVKRSDRPGVVLKMAMSLDGKIAVASGDSRWVSGPPARALVHLLRSRLGAVMVGAGTVLADDPLLTVRLPDQPQPLRVLVQGRRAWPAQLAAYADPAPLVVVSPEPLLPDSTHPNHEVWTLRNDQGLVDLPTLMGRLAARGCQSLLLEGGGALNGAMLAAGLVDHVVVIIAPKLAGDGPTAVSGWRLDRMADALPVQGLEFHRIGDDLLLSGKIDRS